MDSPPELRLWALPGIPLVRERDDLVSIVLNILHVLNQRLQDGDVLIFAQKVVSKSEGRVVDLRSISPSQRASDIAVLTQKDPRLVEVILSESVEVLRTVPGVLIVQHRLGLVMANAGVDHSNVDGDENVLLLPEDPDRSCEVLRSELRRRTGIDPGVLIIDSFGRAWRNGTVGVAIGTSGVPGVQDLRGEPDLFNRPLRVTEIGLADELASAASLLMGQGKEGTPIVLARGVPYLRRDSAAKELVRPKEKDLFR